MRESPLPVFRKVYGRFVAQPLKLPFYIKVTNNTYDVKSFGGKAYPNCRKPTYASTTALLMPVPLFPEPVRSEASAGVRAVGLPG